MRYLIALLLGLSLFAGDAHARKHKYRGLPRDEVGLMNNVLGCLKYKDSVSYYYLFPPFDTLWQMVLHNPDRSPETVKALNKLKEHPRKLIEFDPAFNPRIMGQYFNVLKKGEDSGIHWNDVVMQRYELVKQPITRDLDGYEKIAPERFKGYMFVRDLGGRLTFCITITEIQKINGFFFGGQVLNILEAANIDQFMKREADEKKYFDYLAAHPLSDSVESDSSKTDSLKKLSNVADDEDTSAIARKKKLLSITAPVDDETADIRREVIDRKYYEGKFDDEIPVKLYVRYMKDRKKTGTGIAYDGLYKFGDQEDYVRLTITITPEGKWIMDDDQPIGSMELELKNKIYTGTWTNNESQSGYDVVLKPAVIAPKKLEQLEAILEKGLTGRVDEEVIDDKKPANDKKAKDTTLHIAVVKDTAKTVNRRTEKERLRKEKEKEEQDKEAKLQKEKEAREKKEKARQKALKLDKEMQKAEEEDKDYDKNKDKDEEKKDEDTEKSKDDKDPEKPDKPKDDE